MKEKTPCSRDPLYARIAALLVGIAVVSQGVTCGREDQPLHYIYVNLGVALVAWLVSGLCLLLPIRLPRSDKPHVPLSLKVYGIVLLGSLFAGGLLAALNSIAAGASINDMADLARPYGLVGLAVGLAVLGFVQSPRSAASSLLLASIGAFAFAIAFFTISWAVFYPVEVRIPPAWGGPGCGLFLGTLVGGVLVALGRLLRINLVGRPSAVLVAAVYGCAILVWLTLTMFPHWLSDLRLDHYFPYSPYEVSIAILPGLLVASRSPVDGVDPDWKKILVK